MLSTNRRREILNKRQKEREANAAADAEKKEVEARDELQKHMEHSTLIHRERQMRRSVIGRSVGRSIVGEQ